MPYCIHCTRLSLILCEADVPVELVLLDDATFRDGWFKTAYPKLQTPAMQGTPGGLESSEWVGDFASLLDRAKEQNPRVGAMTEQRGPASVEDVKRLGDRLKYALIGIRLIGTKTTRGKEFLSECLSTAGLDFTTPDDLLRDMVVTAALEAVHEIDALITSTPGAFLGGDKPDIADVFLAPMLLYTHNLLESGIAALPQQPCGFAQLGGASVLSYLDAWTQRPSWFTSFRTTSMVNAALLRPLVSRLVDLAPDAYSTEEMAVCLTVLRRKDPVYAQAIQSRGLQCTIPDATDDASTSQKPVSDMALCEPEDDPLWPFPLPPPPLITPPMPGVPRKAVLSHRASYGAGAVVDGESPLGPLVPFCPYCMRLGLILAEARVPFETYMIDSTNKASWFLEAFPAGTTPAIQGTPGGTSTGEWVGEFETILKNASDQNPQVAAVARVRNTALTVERVQALGGAMSYGLWLTLVAESTCESASGFIAFTRGGAGLEEVSGESGASLRDRAIEGALSALREAESAVSSCAGPFLAGDAPDLVDVYLSSMLHFSRICLEIGLHKLPQGACSLADLGCPSLQRYLEAWVKRDSWGYSYKSTSLDENSAASARVAADMIATSAPDVCGEDVMYPVMCRARRRDSAYQKAIRAVLMPTMPTDMGDVASMTSKEAPTSESDATSSKKESVSLSSDTRTESNDKASSKSLATAPVVGVPVPLDAASRNSGEQASVSGAVSAKKVLKRRKSMKSKSKTNAAICI